MKTLEEELLEFLTFVRAECTDEYGTLQIENDKDEISYYLSNRLRISERLGLTDLQVGTLEDGDNHSNRCILCRFKKACSQNVKLRCTTELKSNQYFI